LDTRVARKVFKLLIRDYFKNKTIVMATHHLEIAMKADNFIIMDDDHGIAFDGTRSELEKLHGNLEKYFMKNNLVDKI